jgi:AcrR family transcriptional regulator
MPRLWKKTIASHREEVESAILDAAAALATRKGLKAVTMREIAQRAGIGRATLYKYFDDVPSLLLAWHRKMIDLHFAELRRIASEGTSPVGSLRRVLSAFGQMSSKHRDSELAAMLHQGRHMRVAHRKLHELVRSLLDDAAKAGEIRRDIRPDELADFCLHALTASAAMPSSHALQRLVTVVMSGLQHGAH